MSERYGDYVFCYGMRRCGCEGRAAEIFVEVGAADAYVRGTDLETLMVS